MQPTASYIIHPYMVWLSIIYRLRELALPKTSRLELRIGASMIILFHKAVIAKGVNSWRQSVEVDYRMLVWLKFADDTQTNMTGILLTMSGKEPGCPKR